MKNNQISVIIPVYNGEKTIKRTLESIVSQEIKPLEIIIINDGSVDNTQNICEEYENKYSYIKLVNLKTNRGVSNARNQGIELAKGNYVNFVDSDDTVCEGMYKHINTLLECFCYDLIIFGSNYVYDDKIKKDVCNKEIKCTKKSEISNYLYNITTDQKPRTLNVIWNKVYSRKIIKQNNLKFEEDIDLGEDFIFNCNYFKFLKNMLEINNIFYNYFIRNSNNLTTKFREDIIYRRKKVYNEWIELYKYYNIYDEKKENEFKKFEGFLMYHSICSLFSENANKLDKIEKINFLNTILNSEHIDTVLYYLKNKKKYYIEYILIKNKMANQLYNLILIKINIKNEFKKILNYK